MGRTIVLKGYCEAPHTDVYKSKNSQKENPDDE
jgi:hypothetical protein